MAVPRYRIMWMPMGRGDFFSWSTRSISVPASLVWSAGRRFGESSLADGGRTFAPSASADSGRRSRRKYEFTDYRGRHLLNFRIFSIGTYRNPFVYWQALGSHFGRPFAIQVDKPVQRTPARGAGEASKFKPGEPYQRVFGVRHQKTERLQLNRCSRSIYLVAAL